jgi:hypothetical protein
MENRAAVFASQPQVVEVYQSGAWWPGELLGWRHQPDGTCEVRVRVVLGGREESAWTDLSALRLPERHLSVAPDDVPGAATRDMPVNRSAARRAGAGRHDSSETANFPLVRDDSGALARVRAAAPRAGGRRRAPETDPLPAVASTALAAARPPSGVAGSPLGRHRAPADPGRHRAADTGMFPAIRSSVTPGVPTPRPVRPEESVGGPPQDRWSTLDDPEPELLTRPMRLSDVSSRSRRPRVDGFLAGV